MISVFLAICLTGTPVPDCTRDTALDWIAAPERQHGLPGCLIHGQQYAANSNLVTEGTFLKVFCTWGEGKRNIG